MALGREIPSDVTRVKGCSCGGLELHTITCTIHDMKPDDARREIEAARDRSAAYMTGLNTGLRQAQMAVDREGHNGYGQRRNR